MVIVVAGPQGEFLVSDLEIVAHHLGGLGDLVGVQVAAGVLNDVAPVFQIFRHVVGEDDGGDMLPAQVAGGLDAAEARSEEPGVFMGGIGDDLDGDHDPLGAHACQELRPLIRGGGQAEILESRVDGDLIEGEHDDRLVGEPHRQLLALGAVPADLVLELQFGSSLGEPQLGMGKMFLGRSGSWSHPDGRGAWRGRGQGRPRRHAVRERIILHRRHLGLELLVDHALDGFLFRRADHAVELGLVRK